MKNSELWRALGRNCGISIVLFGALLGLLWLAEMIFPSVTLLKWHDPAWVVGIPASVIGVAYILTIRDPKNYTGFYAGIVMSILLGIQFMLQGQYDSMGLYFCIFIPLQIISIIRWNKPADDSAKPAFLAPKWMALTFLVFALIVVGDYLISPSLVQLFNGLLIASSIMANFWLIFRKTDSWIYWIVYSVAGIALFVVVGNIFSIVLFSFFLVINSMAGLAWLKTTTKENLGWAKIFVKKS